MYTHYLVKEFNVSVTSWETPNIQVPDYVQYREFPGGEREREAYFAAMKRYRVQFFEDLALFTHAECIVPPAYQFKVPLEKYVPPEVPRLGSFQKITIDPY